MTRTLRLALLLAAGLVATPALAEDDPRFCPTRPDLNAGTCTVEPGHVLAELSAFDWQRTDDADTREDRIVTGDLLVRLGLGPSTEVQLGWTALGKVRTRDKASGAIDDRTRTGDVSVALRQNLLNPDGKGFSVAIQPFVTAPVGRVPVGDGDWGAGVLLPLSYDLSDKLNLSMTGELDAAVDEDGSGRHDVYSGVIGLGYELSDTVAVTAELSVARDDDPTDAHTETLAATSIAWQPAKRRQLDLLAVVGLNRDAPDFRIVTGGAILF